MTTYYSWYHRVQPFRTLYIVYFAVSLLACLPFVALRSAVAPVRRDWTIQKQVMVYVMRNFGVLMGTVGLQLGRDLNKDPPVSKLKRSRLAHAPPIPHSMLKGFVKECMTKAKVETARVPLFWYMLPSQLASFDPTPTKGARVLLFSGGGGFIAGNAMEGELTATACEALVDQLPEGCKLVSVDYRNAHNGGVFPGSLLDVLSAYAYLLELGYQPANIVIGGASAGAIISHQCVRYLLETKILPLPAGQILLCGTWDWTDTAKYSQENAASDWVTSDLGSHARSVYLQGLPSDTVENVYISPLRAKGDATAAFKGFPATFLQVGGAETLLAQNLDMKKRLEAAGVDLTFHLEPEAAHDVLINTWEEPIRSRLAKAIATWISGLSS